mgnify:FL=1
MDSIGKVECVDGNVYWYQYGKFHRDNGLPAIILSDGTLLYYQYGTLHRSGNGGSGSGTGDGPAVMRPNGIMDYYQYSVYGGSYYDDNIKLWHLDGPTITYPNGTKMWYKDGLLHNDNGPAIVHYDGTEEWYQNGVLHRNDSGGKIGRAHV